MLDPILKSLQKECDESLDALGRELSKLRTGRANIAILDGVRVDYYGTATPLKQVANLTTPESRLIQISPWDASQVQAIEKAILSADLGLTPNSDGKIIRIQIPELTEERRKEIAKVARKFAEQGRVSVRSHRKQANDAVKNLLKDKKISEDDCHRYNDEIQKKTDDFIKRVDQALEGKEKEILSF